MEMKREADELPDDNGPQDFGPVIYAYTRAQAIADGVLTDVSDMAWLAGFKYPTALSIGVFELCAKRDEPDELDPHQVAYLLATLRAAIAAMKSRDDRIYFDFDGKKLYSVCGPGDTIAPVITIMLTTED